MRERATTPEILDTVVPDPRLLAHSFREVWGVNRYLGGMAVLKRHLAPFLRQGPMNVLDVAGGTGEVAEALVWWACQRGWVLRITVLDNHPQVLTIARERVGAQSNIQVVQGDARALPFPADHFDVAICNLALHHFTEPDAVAVLRELNRVSRGGWVLSDLQRHPLAYTAARFMAAAIWRSPITQHDGPLSVRRAFSSAELRSLVRQAGVEAVVRVHFPFRLSAACRHHGA